MKTFDYDSYEQYVDKQTEANKRKIKQVWVLESTVAAIVNWYLLQYGESPSKILCHGTRNGAEQRLFTKRVGADIEILGTEISETAEQFPNTIQWDFTKQNREWIGYWDIVYSNSFDHTPTPAETICAWRDQVKDDGLLVIDHSVWNESANNKPDPIDCLDISFEELENLITEHGMEIVTRKPFRTNNQRPDRTYESWFYFIKKAIQ